VQETVAPEAGTTEFQLALTVPASPRYRIQAQVFGTRDRTGLEEFTGQGLQFMGTTTVEPVAGGMHVVIPMTDVVPVGVDYSYYPAYSDSVTWGPVEGAAGYTFYFVWTDTSDARPLPPDKHYFLVPTLAAADWYQLSASFPGGLTSAISERIYPYQAMQARLGSTAGASRRPPSPAVHRWTAVDR
jgi:hypothetical protein